MFLEQLGVSFFSKSTETAHKYGGSSLMTFRIFENQFTVFNPNHESISNP